MFKEDMQCTHSKMRTTKIGAWISSSLREEDTHEAQKEIVSIIRRLEAAGEIIIDYSKGGETK
jgi:hypothetical protein